MDILLANPRGFCAGVDRAIEIVDRVLERFGSPLYVRHEVVHNRFVVAGLRARGAVFVEDLNQVPEGATLIFSAHGVSKAVREIATQRRLRVFDATCPLVTKVHLEVARHCQEGRAVVLIGHRGHPEVEGTLGQCGEGGVIYLVETLEDVTLLTVHDAEHLAFVTQTTLSTDDAAGMIAALRQRFPNIHGPHKSDICYATQNRQDAVKVLARACSLVLVVGSPNSSNSNRLREIAAQQGSRAYLIDSTADICSDWLVGVEHIGVTAGASAPEILVTQVVEWLQAAGATTVYDPPGLRETITFSLPPALRPDTG